ncbi:bifunctional diguanylate cyclase/phosphodiesterase [Rhodoferax mekongensis]|uniref:bifunctional diguanylate cyclase/phosphodiesterase n=1 Tax=Rhodoferax mekongensis TaxID=3068341 RepID=UPI0028BED332|nr:EAL domain-containing protein [Rhodoferax sp. TBRC 17199]MDT7515525.1 EAL domain-containing protein [Rhodoferax sp. TBRC 17199]
MLGKIYERWGVGTKFVAFSLVLLLLNQAAVFFVVQLSINESVKTTVEETLSKGNSFWWARLKRDAVRYQDAASVLARDDAFRGAVNTGDQETGRSAFDNLGGRFDAQFSAFVDLNNSVKVTSTEIPLDEPTVQRLVRELKPAETPPGVREKSDGRYELLTMDQRIYQVVVVSMKAPTTVGWVLMGFLVDKQVLKETATDSKVDVVLFDTSNKVVLSSLDDRFLPAMVGLQPRGELDVGRDKMGYAVSPARIEVPQLVTYMFATINDAFEPHKPVRLNLFYITVGGLVLFAIGSAFLANKVTVSLSALAGAANALGRGDYSQALPAMHHRDEVGNLSRAFDQMRTSIQGQQHEIMQLAYWDRLTGLPNRTQFRDLIKQSIQASSAGGGPAHPVTVIMLNLDRFKHVNDVLGYAFGDQLLKAVADRLSTHITPDVGTVARLGGDEFAVMVEDQDATQATPIAHRIATAFEAPLKLEDQTVDLSAGIGLASWPLHAQDVDMLLSRAEIAMYVAKRKTTGIQIYDPALDSSSTQTLSLLTELRHAVEDGQLRLYLQPKLNLSDNTVIAAEALVRWQHPVRGLVPPMQFIPFAEQTGFVRQLTLWMFEEVAKELPRLRADGRPLRVAINLSTRDLLDQDFPAKLDAMMLKHNAPTNAFCLEITESAIMDDPQRAEATLNRLSERGFKLSIDDFGTGYSSLAYLKRLPVNELKIDKSFVMGMENDESDAKIVRSTIDLAHNLGLSVVAEGVENKAILDKLVELQCDEAQGYFMSKPIPLPDFIAWRAKHQASQAA